MLVGIYRRVHISEATRMHLTRQFEMEPNTRLNDTYLKQLGMSTYFIKPQQEETTNVSFAHKKRVSYSDRRQTLHSIDGVSKVCLKFLS